MKPGVDAYLLSMKLVGKSLQGLWGYHPKFDLMSKLGLGTYRGGVLISDNMVFSGRIDLELSTPSPPHNEYVCLCIILV